MVLLLLLYPLAISQEAKTGPGTVFINHSDVVVVLSSLVSTENQGIKKKKKKPIQVVQDISSFQDLADVLLLGKV